MGMQLIFCVETNKQCKSDYIYIKKTIEQFYNINQAEIKLSPIYMDGKGNYRSNKVSKRIAELKKQYGATSKNNKSIVICCFDCDDYDINQADKAFLEATEKFCMDNGYEFVWFCKEVESVFLGQRISDDMKKKEAENFARLGIINEVDIRLIKASSMQDRRSNLGLILDRYLL